MGNQCSCRSNCRDGVRAKCQKAPENRQNADARFGLAHFFQISPFIRSFSELTDPICNKFERT